MSEKCILVVEDDSDLSEDYREILEKRNFSVVIAKNFQEAILKIKKQKFQCIITDLGLGAKECVEKDGGMSLVEYIRSCSKEKNYNTPIFVISGNIDVGAEPHLKGKIQERLLKPFSIDEFVKKIERLTK